MPVIDEIKNRISIEYLLSRMNLKANNSGFVSSIYREEKTPSMKIYFDNNSYYCFATSKGGDVINLYEDYYRTDRPTAVKELAQLAGISEANNAPQREPMPPLSQKKEKTDLSETLTDYEKSLYEETFYKRDYNSKNEAKRAALRAVKLSRLVNNTEIFKEFLCYVQERGNKEALKYLTKERGLELELIRRFKITAIDNYFEVNNHMRKKFDMELLQKSGLFNAKGNLRFASHKIIIPYLWKNEPIYLRGRLFDNDAENVSKYLGLGDDKLNLNCTKRFFNLDVTRTMFEGEKLFITEGEFDAIAVTQLGHNAIAIPGVGNMPKEEDFKKLIKFEIIICIDSDEAGNGLKVRLFEIFGKLHKNILIKTIPTKDVNDFLTGK